MHYIRIKATFIWNAFRIRLVYFLGKLLFPKRFKKGKPLLRNLGVVSVSPGQTVANISLPSDFKEVVGVVYKDVLQRMSDPRNCIFRSADEAVLKSSQADSTPVETRGIFQK
jgi:hypothetical protein